MHHLEKYSDQTILIGGYRGERHLEWINGNNDRGTLIYNIRLGKNVQGGQVQSQLLKKVVCFAILYNHDDKTQYKIFRVHHHATMTRE